MIELMKNGEINPKKLTESEMDAIVDMRLAYHKSELDSLNADTTEDSKL